MKIPTHPHSSRLPFLTALSARLTGGLRFALFFSGLWILSGFAWAKDTESDGSLSKKPPQEQETGMSAASSREVKISRYGQPSPDRPRNTGPDSATTVGINRGELLPYYQLDPVDIHGRTLTAEERRAYLRLVYNVRKTYPYAVLAKERMDQYNAMRAETEKKRDQRKFLKEEEKRIKDDFMEDLKNMTKSQGAILIKLLARQTDTTAYYLLKDFRGGAKAFAYQTMARFWGYDLKEGYDPHGEDRDIETVVNMIESGRLSTIAPKKTPSLQKGDKKRQKKR